MPPQAITRGDPGTALAEAPLRLSGEFRAGGQEHFYLEGQIAMAVPGEDGDMPVHSSTQHPTEVQHVVARVLGCDYNRVMVPPAAWAAASAARRAMRAGSPPPRRSARGGSAGR